MILKAAGCTIITEQALLREGLSQSSRGSAIQILAFAYSQKGDTEKAKQYDSLSGEYTYTSTLMNGYKGNMDNTAKSYKETETGLLKKWLADAHFDPVREKAWFKALDVRLGGHSSEKFF